MKPYISYSNTVANLNAQDDSLLIVNPYRNKDQVMSSTLAKLAPWSAFCGGIMRRTPQDVIGSRNPCFVLFSGSDSERRNSGINFTTKWSLGCVGYGCRPRWMAAAKTTRPLDRKSVSVRIRSVVTSKWLHRIQIADRCSNSTSSLPGNVFKVFGHSWETDLLKLIPIWKRSVFL